MKRSALTVRAGPWGALLCALALLLAPAGHAQDWPRVALPKEVHPFDIGQQITQNAMPMRLQGFVSTTGPDRLVALFRQSLGQPLVESHWGRQRILGRMQGEFYVSVQIEPAGRGSRGTAAVTHLKAAQDAHDQALQQKEQWMSRLLPGSRLLSQTSSQDGAKLSRHVVFANTHGEGLNRDRLKSLLREDGLAFEREGTPGKAAPAGLPEHLAAGSTLFFKGEGKEALATVHRDERGQTTVVLNVVTQLGGAR